VEGPEADKTGEDVMIVDLGRTRVASQTTAFSEASSLVVGADISDEEEDVVVDTEADAG
jgi:hypothetical protein